MKIQRFIISCLCVMPICHNIYGVEQAHAPQRYWQSQPDTVATTQDLRADGVRYLDAAFPTWIHNGKRYWMHHGYAGNFDLAEAMVWEGATDAPFQKRVYKKNNKALFTNYKDFKPDDGYPWIQSIYQHEDGLLGFVHLEKIIDGGGKKGGVALAWSTDSGATFQYLGKMIRQKGDPTMSGGANQGCPYVVKDGYFYTFYSAHRVGNCVARAPVAEVIAAAKAGTVSPWHKYHNGAWEEPGIDGRESRIDGATGITHSQAFYSTYLKKWFITTTMMTWNGRDTWVKLWESDDLVNWRLANTIVNNSVEEIGKPGTGFQYVGFVDAAGNAGSGEAGDKVYIYAGFRPYESDQMEVRRWLIDFSNKDQDSGS